MARRRLVFVEGLSGSGKSTIAQHLALLLERLGVPARWIYEHETPHPIGTLGQLTAPGGLEAALAGWRALAARPGEALVFDGIILHTTVNALQLVGDDDGSEYVAQIDAAIAPLDPALVYLRPGDVARSIRRIREVRGEWYEQYVLQQIGEPGGGLDAMIAFFERQRTMSDAIFTQLSFRNKLAIDDPASDWDRSRRAITDFLSLPPMDTSYGPVASAHEFAGTYRQADAGDEMRIVDEGAHLFLGDRSRTRLIPRDGGTFLIEGMSATLAFERGGFHLQGPLPGLGTFWTKVTEVAGS